MQRLIEKPHKLLQLHWPMRRNGSQTHAYYWTLKKQKGHTQMCSWKKTEIVFGFKYLGVTLDPTLSFKNHVKKISKIVNFSLHNFRQIRPSLPENAAQCFFIQWFFFLYWILFYKLVTCKCNNTQTNGITFQKSHKSAIENHFLFTTATNFRNITS